MAGHRQKAGAAAGAGAGAAAGATATAAAGAAAGEAGEAGEVAGVGVGTEGETEGETGTLEAAAAVEAGGEAVAGEAVGEVVAVGVVGEAGASKGFWIGVGIPVLARSAGFIERSLLTLWFGAICFGRYKACCISHFYNTTRYRYNQRHGSQPTVSVLKLYRKSVQK